MNLVRGLAALLVVAAPASAGDALPTADATVGFAKAKQKKSFGAKSTLEVDGTTWAYLAFSKTFLPSGVTSDEIDHATLRLWVDKIKADTTVQTEDLVTPWTEATVNGLSDVLSVNHGESGLLVTTEQKGSWVLLDVTNHVRRWVDSTEITGLALWTADENGDVRFASRETKSGSRVPTLSVTR